ncbi:hypothetical protein ACIQV3_13880 [Streptomyces sp. NPDC099050]|uniref:hypothetical protein n=1 Tax=Streptomyces sp. NPDC099050 TaxID=3366100 RepID=UPI0038112E73
MLRSKAAPPAPTSPVRSTGRRAANAHGSAGFVRDPRSWQPTGTRPRCAGRTRWSGRWATPWPAYRRTFGGLTDAAFRMVSLIEDGRGARWPGETGQGRPDTGA